MRHRNLLQAQLMDWAAFHESAEGFQTPYASSTPVYRAMMAQRITEFSSAIPNGVIPPRGLDRICLALNCVKEYPDHARYVVAVQRFYVVQFYNPESKQAAEITAQEYGVSLSTCYEWKKKGENAIEAWLRVN